MDDPDSLTECLKEVSGVNLLKNNIIFTYQKLDIIFPFQLEGIISYFPTSIPIDTELKEHIDEYLTLIKNTMQWDTHL